VTVTVITAICGHITISMLWGNTAYYVKLSGGDLSSYSNKIAASCDLPYMRLRQTDKKAFLRADLQYQTHRAPALLCSRFKLLTKQL